MLDQLTQLGLVGMAQAFAEIEASGEGATRPLISVPAVQAGETKPLLLLDAREYRDELPGSPVSLSAIGSHIDASALRAALGDFDDWAQRHVATFDATTADLVRQLRDAIERQLHVDASGRGWSQGPGLSTA